MKLMNLAEVHNCESIDTKSSSFYFQKGNGIGENILILGESLARTGWLESGKAFYTIQGKMVPTGKRLNEEFVPLNLQLEQCAFTEIAKCYIGKNRKLLKVCGLRSAKHLLTQIAAHEIDVILSLGVTTRDILSEIFCTDLPMGEIIQVIVGNKIVSILPLYHPSPANPYGHSKNIEIISRHKNKIKNLITA